MYMKKRMIAIGSAAVLMLAVLMLAGCGPRTSTPSTPRLTLQVTAPASRSTVTEPVVTITGIVSDSAATVTVKDIPVQVGAGGAFTHDLEVPYGSNTVVVRATLEGQSPISRTLTITRNLVLEVFEPADNSTAGSRQVAVNGKVSDSAALVSINGSPVQVNEDGLFTSLVDLYYVLTTINISTHLEGVAPITKLVAVTYQP